MTPELVFRDQYVLKFLGLSDTYGEKDLEQAILNALEKVILEFGKDFYFVARQKRLTIDNEDYYIDLLFYHRKLRCFIVIDLKLGKFKAEYKGQIELYLRYLEKYEMDEGENPPVGIILCTEKGKELIELLFLPGDHIKVAEYLTKLPSKELFAEKLHKAMLTAQVKLKEDKNVKKFDSNLDFQVQAINSTVNIFKCQIKRSFDCTFQVIPNTLNLSKEKILENLQEVHKRNKVILSKIITYKILILSYQKCSKHF